MAQYHSYARIVQWMNNIQQQYPSIARVVNIGRTVQGRDILGIKLGNPVQNQNKRIVWIDAGIHAREWASIHTALYFINELIAGYGSGDREIIRYLDALNFYIFPCLNPDGYEFTLANPANPEIRLWRKNRAESRCAQNSFGHTRCCQGVDLNRNFDFHFGESGSSSHPCADTYRGETAFSEPESKAVRNFVFSAELYGKIDAFITLHTYSQLWIYSYSHRKFSFPTDVEDMKSLAKKAVSALEKMYGTRYDVGAGPDVIYAFSGGSTDWAKESARVKFSYTIELRPSYHDFNGFILDKSQLIPTARETWAGLKVVVDRVLEDANTRRAGWSE